MMKNAADALPEAVAQIDRALAAITGLLTRLRENHGPANATAEIQEAERVLQEAAAARTRFVALPAPAAVLCLQAGQIDAVQTNGRMDILTIDYAIDTPAAGQLVDVRQLDADGTWTESEPAIVKAYTAPPTPHSAASVNARIGHYRATDGRQC